MKVIAIANQKGGTAKTTSTAAVGLLLSRRGYRVHLIDADPQASLSQAFGISDREDRFACSLIDGEQLPIEMLDKSLGTTKAAPVRAQELRLKGLKITEIATALGRVKSP